MAADRDSDINALTISRGAPLNAAEAYRLRLAQPVYSKRCCRYRD